MMCPHARPSSDMCPHCMGINTAQFDSRVHIDADSRIVQGDNPAPSFGQLPPGEWERIKRAVPPGGLGMGPAPSAESSRGANCIAKDCGGGYPEVCDDCFRAERQRAFAAEGELAFLKNAHDTRIERLEAALREIVKLWRVDNLSCTRKPCDCIGAVAERALEPIRMAEPNTKACSRAWITAEGFRKCFNCGREEPISPAEPRDK